MLREFSRRRPWASQAILILTLAVIPLGTAQALPDLYVAQANNQTLAVLNTGNNFNETATVSTQKGPTAIAVAPIGSPIYIANSASGTVTVMNVNNVVTGTIPVGADPDSIVFSPAGSAGYVASAGANDVSEIDVATSSVLQTIAVGDQPDGMAMTPDGSLLFVSNRGDGTVSVVSAPLAASLLTIPVGKDPGAIAVSPRGFTVYVANTGSNSVSVINRHERKVITTIPVGNDPTGLALSPNGSILYVSNTGSGTLTLIDTATDSVESTLDLGGDPAGLAISPSGAHLYAVEPGQNSVLVISTATRSVTETLGPFAGPESIDGFVGPGDLIAVGGVYNSIENTPSQDTLGCSDVLGRERDFQLLVPPIHGSVTIVPSSGLFTYVPDASFSGEDAFSFICETVAGGPSPVSAPATVSIFVSYQNPNVSSSSALAPLTLAGLALILATLGIRKRKTAPLP
jgi:YVTN family beta-propeller protein